MRAARYVLALVVLLVPGLRAQSTPPVNRLIVGPQAARFLDSLVLDAREHRTENGGCVSGYEVSDSVLTVTRVIGATYLKADSMTIAADAPGICPPGMPTIHTHVAFRGLSLPSDTDYNTGRLRGMWNLLLQARENGWLLFLY